MKKRKILFVVLLSLLFIVPLKVSADMFPKPVAEIEIVGLDQPYILEILIHSKSKVAEIVEEDSYYLEEHYASEDYPFEVLNGYQDPDGYVARTLYSFAPANMLLVRDNVFKTGYHSAPHKFKIALVLEDGTMITSDIIDRKLFDSKITYDVSDVDLTEEVYKVGTFKEHIPFGNMAWKFAVRVILTVLVELVILGLFLYKLKQSYILVGVTNIITQSLLTLFMFIGYYFWGSVAGLMFVLIVGEILVFLCEMIFYGFTLKEQSKIKAVVYGFVANLATLLLSILTIGFI